MQVVCWCELQEGMTMILASICRQRHWDVMEWLFFLNSHAELLYQHMLGDKDTFEIAFMLAGKHSQFHRVPISPGVPLSKLYKNIRQGNWRQRLIDKVVILTSA